MRSWGDEDQRRTLRLVGKIRNRRPEILASRCAWCGKWDSPGDYIRAHLMHAMVTHSICKPCSAKMQSDPTYRGIGSPQGDVA